jgi:acetyl esterase/lipase
LRAKRIQLDQRRHPAPSNHRHATIGVVAISPLTDISADRAVCGTERGCPVFPPQAAAVFARYLAQAHSRITVDGEPGPLASPVAEDLRDMPPVMIHAGADELLVGDACSTRSRCAVWSPTVRSRRPSWPRRDCPHRSREPGAERRGGAAARPRA